MNGDGEDNFDAEMESEALLEEQRATPPLSSKPEGQPAPAGATDKEQDKPGGEPEFELPAELKGKFVPHGRFHETNERLKETNQRYGLLEQRTNKLLEIVQQTLGQNAPKQEQPKDEIPEAGDFVGRLDYVVDKVNGFEKQTKEQQQRSQAEQEGVALGKRVLTATQQDFATAATEDPVMEQAYNHLTNSRVRELMAAQGITKAEAEQAYQQEELQLYHTALQRGERPSAVVKRLAEARGFVPKAPDNANENNREERKLQHRSLSQMGGREGPSALTAKDLAKMSEDEYAKLSDDVIKSIMKKAS